MFGFLRDTPPAQVNEQATASTVPALPGKDYGPHFYAIVAALDDLNRKFDRMIGHATRPPESKQEMMTLGTAPQTYDAKGYRYFGLIAKADVIINVNSYGVTYPMSLKQGYNPMQLIEGSLLSTGSQTTFVAVWSAYEYSEREAPLIAGLVDRPTITITVPGSANDVELPIPLAAEGEIFNLTFIESQPPAGVTYNIFDYNGQPIGGYFPENAYNVHDILSRFGQPIPVLPGSLTVRISNSGTDPVDTNITFYGWRL